MVQRTAAVRYHFFHACDKRNDYHLCASTFFLFWKDLDDIWIIELHCLRRLCSFNLWYRVFCRTDRLVLYHSDLGGLMRFGFDFEPLRNIRLETFSEKGRRIVRLICRLRYIRTPFSLTLDKWLSRPFVSRFSFYEKRLQKNANLFCYLVAHLNEVVYNAHRNSTDKMPGHVVKIDSILSYCREVRRPLKNKNRSTGGLDDDN